MEKLFSGIKKIYENVVTTFGPLGKNVIIRCADGSLKVTKDGVTVANNTFSIDQEEQAGIELIRQAANKSLKDTGDGTSTTVVLAFHMIFNILYDFKLKNKIDINEFKNGAKKALKDIDDILVQNKTFDFSLFNIAKTSSNGDENIAKVVTEVIEKCGIDGHIELNLSNFPLHDYEFFDGYKINNGYLSSKFINNKEKVCFESNNPNAYTHKVLIFDGKLENFENIIHLFDKENLDNKGMRLLIIADDFSVTFLNNCLKNSGTVIPTKFTEFGDTKQFFIDDLCIYTGAKACTKDISFKDLGDCSGFRLTKDFTIIYPLQKLNIKITNQLEIINKLIESSKSEFNSKKLKQRKSSLLGKNAIINVGGLTDSSMNENKDLFEDAIGACRAALKNGVLPGGGISLFRVYNLLGNKLSSMSKYLNRYVFNKQEDDFELGYNMVINSLLIPFLIITNNNIEIKNNILNNKNFHYVYNVKNKQYGLSNELKILDSYETTKACLENATSVALSILTSQIFINALTVEE